MTLSLTTGDLWSEPARAVVAPAALELPSPSLRASREYIERFRERMPLARAIRPACMGGDPDRMPLGDVARAVDEFVWHTRSGYKIKTRATSARR